MKKSLWYFIPAGLCILAALLMFRIGSRSGHLSELKDYCLVPLPLALVAFIAGILQLKNNQK